MSTTPLPRERALAAAASVVDALDRAVVGQRAAAETLVAAYVAGGHALPSACASPGCSSRRT